MSTSASTRSPVFAERAKPVGAADTPLLASRPIEMLLRISRQSQLGDPESCAAVLSLIVAGKIVRANIQTVLGRFELNENKIATLIHLYSIDPDPGAPADLARHAKVGRATMTTMIKAMHARGWIARERADADRRAPRITLTPAGRHLVEEAVQHFLKAVAHCAGTLSPEECRIFSRICAKLCEHFDFETA